MSRLKKAFAILGIISLAAILWGFWIEPSRLLVTEHALDIPWQGRGALRIAVLTDIHVGSPHIDLSTLREVVDATNAARPDLICILGDVITNSVLGRRFIPPEPVGLELGRLRAPAGVVAVLGNHDGWFDHARVKAALEANGVRMVEDTAVRVVTSAGPLWIAGISDLWTGRHDVASALRAVAPDASPVIFLTHNPDVFPEVPPRVNLTLAGHTHGGQVRLPFLGRPIVPSQFGQRFAAGHITESRRHLFVATGIGTSILPVRFWVPPTISVLVVGKTNDTGFPLSRE